MRQTIFMQSYRLYKSKCELHIKKFKQNPDAHAKNETHVMAGPEYIPRTWSFQFERDMIERIAPSRLMDAQAG